VVCSSLCLIRIFMLHLLTTYLNICFSIVAIAIYYLNRSIYSWTIMSNLIFTLCFSFVLMLIYCGLQLFVFDTYFYVTLINHIFKYLFFYCCYCYLYIASTIHDPDCQGSSTNLASTNVNSSTRVLNKANSNFTFVNSTSLSF
jgi:hypothetical protein